MTTTPRFMIAAPYSGAGKTTVTLALLSALNSRCLSPVSFKCGPDYIDPMFHSAVLGIPSYNLDLFFTPADTVLGLLNVHTKGHSVAVIEGVMGFYDGSGTGTTASSFEVAAVTKTPVILVVSAHGAFLSIAATINGFKDFRPASGIAGVILNNCSTALFEMLRDMLEQETGLPMLGCLPHLPECSIGSRHLGLVTAEEICDLKHKLDRLGEEASNTIDLDRLLRIAGTAPPVVGSLPLVESPVKTGPRIAVAQDAAFCFYYADNLNLLERCGAQLVPFSPLRDEALPDGVHALYLGGGYPELYTKVLSKNAAMLQSIRQAIQNGLPTFAECGGFLYLHDTLEDDTGTAYPMVGVIPGRGFKTDKLQRFGYISVTAQVTTPLCAESETIPAHEFHYWDSSNSGSSCTALRLSGKSWPCVIASRTLFAGFPHLYFYGNPAFALNFVKAAAHYAEKCQTNTERPES